MYQCHLCRELFIGVKELYCHLRNHEAAGELRMTVRCCQDKCTSSFRSLWNLKRHMDQYHSQSHCEKGVSHSVNNSNSLCYNDDFCNYEEADQNKRFILSDIHIVAKVYLVSSLRSNSCLPHNIISCVIPSFNNMADCLVNYLNEQVLESLKYVPNVNQGVLNNIEKLFKKVQKPLGFLSRKYKQDKYFAEHPLFVNSETLSIGSRYEVKNGVNKLVYDTYEYVSVENNFRSLFSHEEFVELILTNQIKDNDLTDCFQKGERCKKHYLFINNDKYSIMIQLFYDGMGKTNPLRGNASTSNVGVTITIQNLPPSHNSCFANIHLLALCYSQDLKVYGYNNILERFVSEIQKLQSIGFSGDFQIIGSKQIYLGLRQVSCDNLALNGLFGFIECFFADFFCTICLATKETIQLKTYESDFEMRTIDSYNNDLKALEMLALRTHSHGVKANCCLNKIPGFHVVENFALDPMHTLLEGVVPFELGCILYYLIKIKHYFSLLDLNTCMHQFFDHNSIEKSKRPSTICQAEKPGRGLTHSMKSVQMRSLLMHLPIL
ncbi:uncharacterized protein LOC124816727 [Hydra vulgaris]|uniref:uncharacterized protein LOC124816727 n=1 Tax=Hydra vulgaris TaxID=6087 RepID=UPI0032E9C1ED